MTCVIIALASSFGHQMASNGLCYARVLTHSVTHSADWAVKWRVWADVSVIAFRQLSHTTVTAASCECCIMTDCQRGGADSHDIQQRRMALSVGEQSRHIKHVVSCNVIAGGV